MRIEDEDIHVGENDVLTNKIKQIGVSLQDQNNIVSLKMNNVISHLGFASINKPNDVISRKETTLHGFIGRGGASIQEKKQPLRGIATLRKEMQGGL